MPMLHAKQWPNLALKGHWTQIQKQNQGHETTHPKSTFFLNKKEY